MSTELFSIASHLSRSKEQRFYQQTLDGMMTAEVRRFFLEYSGIPNEEQDMHIYQIVSHLLDVVGLA